MYYWRKGFLLRQKSKTLDMKLKKGFKNAISEGLC